VPLHVRLGGYPLQPEGARPRLASASPARYGGVRPRWPSPAAPPGVRRPRPPWEPGPGPGRPGVRAVCGTGVRPEAAPHSLLVLV